MQTKQECRTALGKGERITSLAALVEVALDDAQRLDRKRYVPHKGHWLRLFISPKTPDKRCHLCLAGMTLTRTIGAEPHTESTTARRVGRADRTADGAAAVDQEAAALAVGLLESSPRTLAEPRKVHRLESFDRVAKVLREKAVPTLREIEAQFLATEGASC